MPLSHLLLLGLLVLGANAQADPPATDAAEPKPGKLSVSGTASVTVQPDVGKIYVSVTVGKPSVAEACGVAANTTDAVLTAAASATTNVTTTNISVQPNITYGDNGQQTSNGFTCTQSLLIKVEAEGGDKLDAAISSAVDAALAAGGDYLQVSSLETDLSNDLRLSATNQAREQAVANAQQTADILAKSAKVKLGSILSIVDSNVAPPTPIPYAAAGANAAMDAAAQPSTPIQTGPTDVYATVAIDYAISPAA